jgi:hypothetical protein
VRYLEDCVAKLKEQNNTANNGTSTPATQDYVPTNRDTSEQSRQYNYDDEDEGSDVEMANDEAISPTSNVARTPTAHTHTYQSSHQPSVSPALLPQDYQRHNSYSSTSLSNSTSHDTDHRHYSYSTSATTSPAFGPQSGYEYAISNIGSALTSPALLPQRDGSRDLDQEATAALLMLNSDRRGTNGSSTAPVVERGRGMSVRDLLST